MKTLNKLQIIAYVLYKNYINNNYSNNKQQVKMKIQIKSVLKSHFQKIRCMEQNQIVHPVGNNMFISEIGKLDGQFISLGKQNCHIYDFAVSPKSTFIFTAEKTNNCVQVCRYNQRGERKVIKLSQDNNHMPLDIIDSIQILTGQIYQSIVFVVTKAKNDGCISLLDFNKTQIVASGFVTQMYKAFVCSEQDQEIHVSGRGFLKKLKLVNGAWEFQQILPRKLLNLQIYFSKYLSLGRTLVASKTNLYVVSPEHQIMQIFNITTQQDPIQQILKIKHGFITFTQNQQVKLYIEQAEDGQFILQQQTNLGLEQAKIVQVQFNRNTYQIIIVYSNGKYYHCRMEEFSTNSNKQNYFNFDHIKLSNSQPQMGSISTTPGQNYCLISSQKNIQLWDLKRLCPTINLQVSNLGQDKVVKATAINPDGHSICVGYSDRIKFYRILLNKFKEYREYPIKNTILIQYSHGGQLVGIIYGKGLNSSLSVINTLNLKQIASFKLGFKPLQVVWNEHDDEVYVSGQDTKIVSVYLISNKTKKSSFHFDSPITFIRFDYLTRKIMVSCQNQIHLIDSDQKSQTILKPNIPNFDYVFPVEGMYLATDKNGGLYCSNNIQFDKYQYIAVFVQQRIHLLYRKGIIIAYSSPANAILLKLKLNNEQFNSDTSQNIIMVQRDQITKFFQKIRILQNQLDQLQASTSLKLQQQRRKYNQSLQDNEKIFKQQILSLQNSVLQIQTQKSKQEKKNAKVFDQLQIGQIKSVNDLEKVYDMKIKLQKQKYLALQQENLQQKMKYDNIVKGLEQKYQRDIEITRKQYAQKLSHQIKLMQSQKQRQTQYRKKVESKLIDLEQQSEMTIFEVQINKDNQIKNLIQRYTKLQRQYDSKMIDLNNTKQDLKDLKQKYQETVEKIKKNQKIVQDNINKVGVLQKQIQKKNKIIQQKNASIEQQAHQIDGLQKAKYVLSFRTNQVRKWLQPKQQLIQKLKSQLFKLDEQYKNQTKKSFDLNQKLQKIQKISQNYRKQNNQMKMQLKNKQRTHNDLCSQLFMLVNNTDAKDWNKQIVKIYKNYVHQQKIKHRNARNDESTTQQINRHLIHVQQSLHQVATGNQKMLKGKQKQVVRKMMQNAELVYDLNIMRKKQNQLLNEIKQKTTQISRLKRQLNQYTQMQKSTRANTAVTGATRRLITKDADWIDLSMKRQSGYLIPERQKGRVFSANKTMVTRQQTRREKTKISDLAKELQSAKNTIMRQDRMIQELNQRLLGLPQQHFV